MLARRVTGTLLVKRLLVKLSTMTVMQISLTGLSDIFWDNGQSKFAVLTSIAQLSHTDCGIKFNFISQPKTKHPAQNPSIDSREAKKPITAIRYLAESGEPKTNMATIAEEDINNPTS